MNYALKCDRTIVIEDQPMRSIRALRGCATLIVVSGVVALSGCASTNEMDELRKMAADAMAAAQQAQAAADRAQAAADSAAGEAASAMQRADEANACCKANTERMNRMFKKSMQK